MSPEVSNLERDIAAMSQRRADAFKARKSKTSETSADKSTPKAAGAGFMGGEVDLDAREAEETRSRKTGTEVEGTQDTEAAKSPEVILSEPVKGKVETVSVVSEKTLEELKADLDAKRLAYARMDIDISGRWNRLKKVLGFSVEEIKDSGVEDKKREYKEALKKYLDAKRGSLGDITKEQAAELYKEFTVNEATMFLEAKSDESAKMKKERGEWPEKIVDGYMNIVKNFCSLSFKKKILISAGIMAGGLAAGMTFGVVGAGVFSIAGAGYRAISGGASGLGLKKLMDAISSKRETKTISKEAEKILSQEDWLAQLNAELDNAVNTIDSRISRMESKDLTRRRIATYAGIFVGSGAMAQIIHSTGLGGVIKEKLFGGGTVRPSVSEQVGGSIKLPTYQSAEEALPKSFPEKPSTGLYPEGKYGPAGYGTETEGHEDIIESTHERYGYGKYGELGYGTETETEGHIPTAEVQAPEIAKPQLEEIASVKIGKGGTMWGSIENSIRANPEAYGLDPNDPNFAKEARRMTKQILDEFASRKGLSYEQLDKIARAKIQPGDTFKIIYDPSTEEIYLDDFHGKAFGPDIAETAPAEEITSSKPKLAPEEVKPKTAATDQQPAKTRGEIKTMEEIEADYRKDLADREYARAVRAEQDWQIRRERLLKFNESAEYEARLRQFLSTRGLLNRIVEGAGIGSNVSFWEGSASDWYDQILSKENYIAQDIQFADEVEKLNLNLNKLKELFSKLGRPTPGQKMSEYLQKAMENSKNVELINQIILRK